MLGVVMRARTGAFRDPSRSNTYTRTYRTDRLMVVRRRAVATERTLVDRRSPVRETRVK